MRVRACAVAQGAHLVRLQDRMCGSTLFQWPVIDLPTRVVREYAMDAIDARTTGERGYLEQHTEALGVALLGREQLLDEMRAHLLLLLAIGFALRNRVGAIGSVIGVGGRGCICGRRGR